MHENGGKIIISAIKTLKNNNQNILSNKRDIKSAVQQKESEQTS